MKIYIEPKMSGFGIRDTVIIGSRDGWMPMLRQLLVELDYVQNRFHPNQLLETIAAAISEAELEARSKKHPLRWTDSFDKQTKVICQIQIEFSHNEYEGK